MRLSTPRADIEEWFKREETRLLAKNEDEFQKKINDYFRDAGKRSPGDEKMARLVDIAKDTHLIRKVGILRRIIGLFRRVFRI